MNDDTIERIVIDPNLDAYKQFFDHEWCKRIFASVHTSRLKPPLESLMVAWRSTNGTHHLPWLMVHSLRGFAEGHNRGSLQFRADYSGEVVRGIVEKIETRMRHNFTIAQKGALKRVVKQIEEEAFEAEKIAEAQFCFDTTGYWESLIRNPDFVFSILGSQRASYGSLLFAYEDFLANTIKTKHGSYDSKREPIKKAFAEHFGDQLRDFCWTDPEIELAMFVRHTLAHNGGRFGVALEKYEARFVDAGEGTFSYLQGDRFNRVAGKIQIAPSNTTYLFGILKDRVTKIVEELK